MKLFENRTSVAGDTRCYHVVNNDRVTQLASGRLLARAASSADVIKENHLYRTATFQAMTVHQQRQGSQALRGRPEGVRNDNKSRQLDHWRELVSGQSFTTAKRWLRQLQQPNRSPE